MYISSIIPAFLGITEPVIFGINLRFVKPFICGLIGGACAGATASIMQLAGTGMGITVIPGMLLYMDRLSPFWCCDRTACRFRRQQEPLRHSTSPRSR